MRAIAYAAVAVFVGIIAGCAQPRNESVDAAVDARPDGTPIDAPVPVDASVDAAIPEPNTDAGGACANPTWKLLPAGAGIGEIYDVWASGSNNIVAVNSGVKQFNGATWQTLSGGGSFVNYAVGGKVAGEVLVAGNGNEGGTVWTWNGSATALTLVTGAASTTGYGIWQDGAGDIFMAGYGGKADIRIAGTWSHYASAQTGTTQILSDVHGADGNMYFVGWGGAIVRYKQGFFNVMPSPTTKQIVGVWAATWDNVWAVTNGGGDILHYDGTAWTIVPNVPATAFLEDIWGSGPSDVYAVGAGGAILHYNGTTWSSMTSPVNLPLRSIYGVGPCAMWAAGQGGNVIELSP